MIATVSNAYPDRDQRGWVQAIIAQWVAAGWVRTSDAGQINEASYTATGSVDGTVWGYAMFRMADALQATAPVFVKVRFVNSWNTVFLRVSIGQGSDGAGNLTGRVSPELYFGAGGGTSGAGNSSGSNGTCYFSGDTSRFGMWLWDDRGNSEYHNAAFFIERTHDATGADTGEGVMAVCRYGGGTNNGSTPGWYSYLLPFEAGRTARPRINRGPACVLPGDAANTVGDNTAIDGADTGVFEWRVPSQRGHESPMKGLVSIMGSDAAWDALPALLHYGANHTYRVMPSEASYSGTPNPALQSGFQGVGLAPMNWARIAMLWE
jgi:hypothetical protein